jgi:hypothetical protein
MRCFSSVPMGITLDVSLAGQYKNGQTARWLSMHGILPMSSRFVQQMSCFTRLDNRDLTSRYQLLYDEKLSNSQFLGHTIISDHLDIFLGSFKPIEAIILNDDSLLANKIGNIVDAHYPISRIFFNCISSNSNLNRAFF